MNVYLEASAVVKLLRDEDGSEQARMAASPANVRMSCVITYAEACSALARAASQGVRVDVPKGRSELDAFWADVHLVEVNDPLARRAADLAVRHRLRGMDAVHLASALQVRPAGEVSIVTWDRELREAARREGIGLLPLRL